MAPSFVRRAGTRRAALAGCLAVLALSVAGCAGSGGGGYQIRWQFFSDSLFRPDGLIINGIYLTIVISVIAQGLGVVLGIFAALGKMARFLPFRLAAQLYIWIFRGTPLLVQLTFFYFGVASAGLFRWPTIEYGPIHILPEIFAGTLIMGVNEGAYMAEIVRAGILSIDPGQNEAAKSLGMTYAQTMRRIVLPQAARVIIPPLGNEFNNMLKTTSLLSALSVYELFTTMEIKGGNTYATFEFLLACAIWFLLLTTIWGLVQVRIERRFGRGTASSNQDKGLRARLFGGGRSDVEPSLVSGGR